MAYVFLEDDVADVVAKVAFALQLLLVLAGEGQQGGDVEHNLLAKLNLFGVIGTGALVWRVMGCAIG